MTVNIRRKVVLCLAMVALTIPAETVLLRAISTTSEQQAAQQWASAISDAEAEAAAAQVRQYPYAYRREILRRVSPVRRSEVWRGHFQSYIDNHPTLDDSVRALIYNASALASPQELAQPTPEGRAQMSIIAEQMKVLVGKTDTEELFYWLGSRDSRFANAAPLRDRLASVVRGWVVASARVAEDCDCNDEFGCLIETAHCAGGRGCDKDEDWPMCGWLWNQVCDGLCSSGSEGS